MNELCFAISSFALSLENIYFSKTGTIYLFCAFF